jgi:hypothetical protein
VSPPQLHVPEPLPFTVEQKTALVDAVYDAQMALLRAIATEAERTEALDSSRNIPRLTQALHALGLAG